MKLVEIALENFRGYGDRTTLVFDDLTILVGKNDAGKSTFLEALNVVLGDGKIDASDIHVRAPETGASVGIECTFEELPGEVTLDATSVTSLEGEYLVDHDGRLRIRWTYGIGGDASSRKLLKQQVGLVANHPTDVGCADLHSKKNADLKKLVKELKITENCDLSNNASMRQAIWTGAEREGPLALNTVALQLAKEDGKTILDQLRAALPMYVLFRADRPSTDQDAEVQDPMKVAVRTALEELQSEVGAIRERVKERALEVAARTLGSLRDFDDALASSLTPEFAEPQLEKAFKLSLQGDDGIAVNKRGSGVRRLVLFSFFRAEAERHQRESSDRGIIYAVEEPETAQHPDFQRKIVGTLCRLAETEGCQVLATTHSPGLAGLAPSDSLRLIYSEENSRRVATGEQALSNAWKMLGVVPDHRVRVLLCVEGPHDRAFFQRRVKRIATQARTSSVLKRILPWPLSFSAVALSESG